jgi:Domain of unknown function (DUF6475)
MPSWATPMDNADRKPFADILQATYTEVYQREPLSKTALTIWWASMSRFTFEQFTGAMTAWIQRAGRGQHPPKPADIIEMVAGTGAERAVLAWHQVHWAMARVGGYQSVCFGDPISNLTIEQMGGWPKLCLTPEAELPFRAKDFQTAYAALCGREVSYPGHLAGSLEIEAYASGRAPSLPTVLIGEGALAVSMSGRAGPPQITTSAAQAVQAIANTIPKLETP